MNLVFVHNFGEFITHQMKGFLFLIPIPRFRQTLRKRYFLKFVFSKGATMIIPLIHGGKKRSDIL